MAKATLKRREKVVGTSPSPSSSNRAAVRANIAALRSSHQMSIEELAAQQGVKPTRLDDILGKGADLWDSNEEFEQFVADIYSSRRDSREPAKS